MSLVTIDWLENNLNKVKIIDCSWHMPNVNRNANQEYIQEHIPGAIFLISTNILILKLIFHICYQIQITGKKLFPH